VYLCVFTGVPVIEELQSIIESRGMTATLLCRSYGHPSPAVTFRRLRPSSDTVYLAGRLYVSHLWPVVSQPFCPSSWELRRQPRPRLSPADGPPLPILVCMRAGPSAPTSVSIASAVHCPSAPVCASIACPVSNFQSASSDAWPAGPARNEKC